MRTIRDTAPGCAVTNHSVRHDFFYLTSPLLPTPCQPASRRRSAGRFSVRPALALGVGIFFLALAGCSSDDPEPSGPEAGSGGSSPSTGGGSGAGSPGAGGSGPAGPLEYSACADADHLGGFEVNLQQGALQGQVLSGVIPSRVPTVVTTAGECRLLQGRNLFCDPACGSSETCGETGSCVPTPLGQAVGSVVVRGARTSAGATEVTLEPTPSHFYSTRAELAKPPFEPGAELSLTAGGSDFAPAFTLRGEGIAPLEVPEEDIAVEPGTPLALRWTPPPAATAARVEIHVQFNLHGTSAAAYIACEVPDSGSFDVPASLIDELLGRELSGFPTIELTRKTSDSVEVPSGCVDFVVTSQVSRAVEVPGITSCNEDADCEPGQVCTRPQLICE